MKDGPAEGPEREVFGSPAQRRLLRLGEQAMRLLSRDPRFSSHGRGVSLADYEADTADLMEALAHLLGLSVCERVPPERTAALVAALKARGFAVDMWRRYAGFECETARASLGARPAPEGLRVEVIGPGAPSSLLAAYAEVAQPQDVLQANGGSLRGELRPGFGLVAFAPDGTPVAVAASVMSHHPGHRTPRAMQWGQIATAAEWQGKGVARWLGALSILHAFETLGASEVYTGIREGNAPSIALCEGLGVVDAGLDIVAAIDPEAFGAGRLTK